jgi:hypothetical protein
MTDLPDGFYPWDVNFQQQYGYGYTENGQNNYYYDMFQIYKVVGITKTNRSAYKEIELEVIRNPIAK